MGAVWGPSVAGSIIYRMPSMYWQCGGPRLLNRGACNVTLCFCYIHDTSSRCDLWELILPCGSQEAVIELQAPSSASWGVAPLSPLKGVSPRSPTYTGSQQRWLP